MDITPTKRLDTARTVYCPLLHTIAVSGLLSDGQDGLGTLVQENRLGFGKTAGIVVKDGGPRPGRCYPPGNGCRSAASLTKLNLHKTDF